MLPEPAERREKERKKVHDLEAIIYPDFRLGHFPEKPKKRLSAALQAEMGQIQAVPLSALPAVGTVTPQAMGDHPMV
ncbi:hypothetical protein N7540_000730 [Penicillium herquei]|nr:hypothetical protein N7540_000730 [Penicillium herquei]